MALDLFNKIFSETIDEFKKKHELYIKTTLYILVIPQLIITLLAGLGKERGIILAIGIILMFVIHVINSIAIILITKTKKKTTVKKIFEESKKFIPRMIGLLLLTTLLLILLGLLLIIPAIIFGIFWAFAMYILVLEDKGIKESLKLSKKLVKGRWWQVFGYFILLGLIILLLNIAVGIIQTPINLSLNTKFPTVVAAIETILGIAITVVITPFSTIFSKIFYDKLKNKK